MSNFLNKIELKFSTLLFFILILISGTFKKIFILFLLSFLHELGHLFFAFLFKIPILKIKILPIGMQLHLDSIESLPSYKQLFIYIGGPLTFFLNRILGFLFYSLHFLSPISYSLYLSLNISIFLFNLLPLFPLDGYQILKSILQYFLPFQKVLKSTTFCSLIFFFLFILSSFYSFQPLLILFFLIEQIKHKKELIQIYKQFLITKTKNRKYPNFKIIPNYDMYKEANNYKIENKNVLNDVEIAYIELKKYVE